MTTPVPPTTATLAVVAATTRIAAFACAHASMPPAVFATAAAAEDVALAALIAAVATVAPPADAPDAPATCVTRAALPQQQRELLDCALDALARGVFADAQQLADLHERLVLIKAQQHRPAV